MRSRSTIVNLVIAFLSLVCCLIVVPTQALPTVKLGLSGKLLVPPDQPVTLALSLPRAYGLTAWERRAGLEPLNHESPVEVTLGDSPFVVELPRVTYCTRMWLWQGVPPAPPVMLMLRFSDAPEEAYVIWGSQYDVLDADHHTIRQDIAGWKLEIGQLRYQGGLGRNALWTPGPEPRSPEFDVQGEPTAVRRGLWALRPSRPQREPASAPSRVNSASALRMDHDAPATERRGGRGSIRIPAQVVVDERVSNAGPWNSD